MEPPCFNNNQRTWQKRLLAVQRLLWIAAGCILILQAVPFKTAYFCAWFADFRALSRSTCRRIHLISSGGLCPASGSKSGAPVETGFSGIVSIFLMFSPCLWWMFLGIKIIKIKARLVGNKYLWLQLRADEVKLKKLKGKNPYLFMPVAVNCC